MSSHRHNGRRSINHATAQASDRRNCKLYLGARRARRRNDEIFYVSRSRSRSATRRQPPARIEIGIVACLPSMTEGRQTNKPDGMINQY